MKKFHTSLIIFVGWVAVVPPTRAQFLCKVTDGERIGSNLYSGYRALTCNGNDCTVVAETVPDSANGFGPVNGFGHLVFLHSSDGGHTWAVETDPSFARDSMGTDIRIDQIDSLNIIASGNFGSGPWFSSIFRTTDGGVTWHQQPAPTEGIGGISFSTAEDGIVLAGLGVFTTTDGGMHWESISFYPGNVSRCHAYGNGKYRLFQGNTGKIYTTTDNWATVDSTPAIFSDPVQGAGHIFEDCKFGSGDTMIACGFHNNFAKDTSYPYLARTTDGGEHWVTVYDDTTGAYGDIYYPPSDVNRDTIIAGVNTWLNAVLCSTDNGTTWEIDSLRFNDEQYRFENQDDGVGLNSDGDLVGAFDYWTNSVFTSFLTIGQRVTSAVISDNIKTVGVSLFPNPTSTSITVTGGTTGSTVHLLDILGRDILSTKVPASGTLTLDVSSLPRGIYT